jgi:hypothetical protein
MAEKLHSRNINLIKGLSERRRLPRLGKIRLGVKKTGSSGNEFPSEVDYFVCPPEIQRVYGPQPKVLRIMIPLEDTSLVFPQAYKWYGTGAGLKCKGNGQVALRRYADVEPALQAARTGHHDANDLVEIPCPCPLLKNGECGVKAHLMVILPDVSLSGIYQIDTGSLWNLVEINSSLDFLRGLLGRIAFIPLTLRRQPVDISYQGKRRTHYLLKLTYDGDLQAVQRLRESTGTSATPSLALPAPSDEENGISFDTPTDAAPTATTPAVSTSPTPTRDGGFRRDGNATATLAVSTSLPAIQPPADSATLAPTEPAPAPESTPAEATTAVKAPAAPTTPDTCACGAVPSENVANYSRRYFGEVICLQCQKLRFGVRSGKTAQQAQRATPPRA